jgi:hypothetical protein
MRPSDEDRASARQRLYDLLCLLEAASVTVEHFCAAFETIFNLELDKSELSPAEHATFSELFEKVVWYSPLADERARIPHYLGEEEIREAAHKASATLGIARTA